MEKMTKTAAVFMQNKPNSPIVQMDINPFITMNYPVFASLTKVKNKPNQTQYKPNSKPIASKGKIDAKCVFTRDYDDFMLYKGQKTKPIQTQNKPNWSEPKVLSMVEGIKPNFKGKSYCRASHQPLLLRVNLSDTSIRFFIT